MIVIDSSFFLTGVFGDEENPLVFDVFNAIERLELQAIAPSLFFYEIHNSLLTAMKRKRVLKSQMPEFITLFSMAPILVVENGESEDIMKIAFTYGLSFYDASYLELAKRKNIPLATLDQKLYDAAVQENRAYSKTEKNRI